MASSTLVDSTTGDTSALSKLPSGYTASVVLPGGVRRTKAISTPADAKMRSRGNQQTPESIPAADVAFPIREVYFLHSNNKPMVNVLNQGKELPHTACDVALYLSTKATPPGVVHQPPRRQAAPPGAALERAAAAPRSISTPANAKMRSRDNQQTPESIPAADVAFPIRGVYFLHSNKGDRPPHPGRCTRGPQRPHGASPPPPTPRCAAGATSRRQAAPPGAVHQRAAAAPRSISTPADAKMRSRGNQPASTRRRRAFRPCWNYVRTCLTRGGSCRIHHAT